MNCADVINKSVACSVARYARKILQLRLVAMVIFFALCFLCVLISCRSLHEPKSVYERLNYTEADVYENEKKRIIKLAESAPVEALWSAKLLGDEEAVAVSAQKTLELYNKSIGEKKFLDALKYFRSLKSSGEGKLLPRTASEETLRSYVLHDVPGLSVAEQHLPKTIADCINATVTVWVARGIAIKNGMGYADNVIGSGFFIDKRGYIVTNYHVIEDMVNPKNERYSRLYVKLASDSDTRIPAKVVGYDAVLDLALLKAEVDAPFVLALGTSSDLEVGDRVSAIGTPLGLDGTLTQGIVSAIGRKLFTTGSVLQIDTAINSGNSGGPLIDSHMRVQAVVFAGIRELQGLNFAIPVEYLRQNLPVLYRGGALKHAWTASYGHTKKSSDGKENLGLEVQYVMPGGSMHRAGFMSGDVITSFDGKKVSSIETMQDILRSYTPDTIGICEFLRGDEKHAQLVYLAPRPENPGHEIYNSDLITGSFVPIFGMKLVAVSTSSRRAFAVTEIINGSIADETGFSENDPINISSVNFSDDNSRLHASIYTRRRKKGFLDIGMVLSAVLDSPYYF